MWLHNCIIVSLISSVLLLNYPEDDLGIVNGLPLSVPYQAYLIFEDSNEEWYCGGSIISKNYILTAGACTLERDGIDQKVTIYLGAYNISALSEEGRVEVESSEIITHEDLINAKRATDNIGLVKLPSPITFNSYIQSISLESRNAHDENLVYSDGIISGWGSTDLFYDEPDTLRVGNITIVPNSECGGIAPFNKEAQLCGKNVNATTDFAICDRDLGGPLVVNDTLVGIIFFSSPICDVGYPQMFIKISSYFDWIEEHSDVIIE